MMKILLLFYSIFLIVNAQQEIRKLASTSNEFCFSLLKTFSTNQNVFFSPASIYVALGMLYAGARGSTAETMQSVLGYGDEENVHRAFSNLINLLTSESAEYRIELANALVYQQSFHVSPQFKEILQIYYGALVKELDFEGSAEKSLEEINQWVEENTNRKIPKLLDELPPDLIMMLLNAVYFKGIWQKKFDPELTQDATFYNDGVNEVTVSMMNIKDHFPYVWYPQKRLSAVELPYKGEDISMLIILPLRHDQLDEIEKNLDEEGLKDIISRLKILPTKIDVSIPKFNLEDCRKLKSNLTYLGLDNIFNRNADFTGINNDNDLLVSEILHKATIEVNEEGSEIAAVSGIELVPESAIGIVYANHPFLFFIRDLRTNMILFAGRVTRLYVIMAIKVLMVLLSVHFTVNAESQQLKDLVLSSNEFCFSLLKTFPDKQNVFFSPASIYISLGMLYAGAEGWTAEDMRRVLNYQDNQLNDRSIHEIFGSLINFLKSQSSEYRLEIANAVIFQENFHVSSSFRKVLQNYYEALIKEINFEGESEAIKEINEWVRGKTNGKIPNFLNELPPDIVMILLNAVYFKGTWHKRFDPKSTADAYFYNNGVDRVLVQMMHIDEYFPMNWYPDKGLRAIELSYKGNDVSMVIVLPFSNVLDGVEQNLNYKSLNEIISQLKMSSHRLSVVIPKFRLEDSRELKENLTYLGLGSLFNRFADFSGISNDKKILISNVFHQAVIEVNEQGTEAASVNAFEAVPVSSFSLFNVDHPFLFFIRERRTNLILFAGRVNNL
ncbi:intracellular coagulation inhibitor 2-like [Centruroides vittatus]|uniref:intracellular coagulation inhibitor 2-like n=1 Tax=Centruroides vittatus TaxID=120091 RepID=UPI00351043D3